MSPSRATAIGVIIAASVLVGAAPAAARRNAGAGSTPAGLRPGLYSVSILAPTLEPALTIDEQVLHLCYTPADARAHANPIMPAPERAGCDSPDLLVGNVLTFDATCKDGLQQPPPDPHRP